MHTSLPHFGSKAVHMQRWGSGRCDVSTVINASEMFELAGTSETGIGGNKTMSPSVSIPCRTPCYGFAGQVCEVMDGDESQVIYDRRFRDSEVVATLGAHDSIETPGASSA